MTYSQVFLNIALDFAGVDDAFLMLHAWKRQLPTYDHLSIDERYKMIPFMFGKILEEVFNKFYIAPIEKFPIYNLLGFT